MDNTGVWSQWQADTYHQSSPKLAAWMANYLDRKIPIVDFGCGNAFYISELEKKGFTCMGVEGEALNNFQHKNILISNLADPATLFDVMKWAPSDLNCISLEVGEHIPKEFEQIFLDTVTSGCTDFLILSWALLGQPGIGHVNCQPQEYIINEIERRGFWYMEKDTLYARDNVDENCNWFRNTILVFKKI